MVRRGPPAKWNAEIERRVIDAISAGNYYEAACAYAGISMDTFERQKKKSAEFAEKVLRAEGQAEVATIAHWRKQMPDSWQACRDFVGRRFPERWATNREKGEQSGPAGGPIQVQITEMVIEAGNDDGDG